MKKSMVNFSVFTLLLSLMLSFVVPVPAAAATETTADDVKYIDIEDFMNFSGYYDFDKTDGLHYFVFLSQDYLYVYEIYNHEELYLSYDGSNFWVFRSNRFSDFNIKYYKYYNFEKASVLENYLCLETSDVTNSTLPFRTYSSSFNDVSGTFYRAYNYPLNSLVYSDLPFYSVVNVGTSSSPKFYKDTSVVLFEATKYDEYVFPVWCSDAGLNCLASSNESPTKIPYSYNSYWHIVRKTSNGKWLLTTIGNSVMADNPDDYKLYLEDGNLVAYSIYGGDDANGYLLNVRHYEYDTDGWKVRTYDTYDFRETSQIVDLGSGSGFDDTRKLAYNNVGIYTDSHLNPTYPASTEYYEITTPDVPEDSTPTLTPTPTSTPSGGGRPGSGTRPDTGGQATGGSGLDFIINLFTLIWSKICAIPMSVDGYSISLQQIIVYGALVSIVGGFILHFIFGRK